MHFSSIALFEAITIASALSIDGFVAGFAYGGNKIKIPMLSVQIINLICAGVLGLSLFAGTLLRQYIPPAATKGICSGVLLLLGLVKLLDGVMKSIIRKHANFNRQVSFSMFSLKFILHLYANPEDADVDASRTISPVEAASLAAALSLDGMAVGFGAAIGNVSALTVVLCSLVICAAAVISGGFLGNRLARNIPFNLSWLSGALLIFLAFFKIL